MGVFAVNDFDDQDDFAPSQDAERSSSYASMAGELDEDVRRAQRLAALLDSEFSLFGVHFGADSMLGLVPVIGDALGFFAGLYPIHVVRKHGLGRRVEQRMILNLLIDAVGGAVPLIGDIFDIAFKANQMNVRLLKRAAASKRHRRPVHSRQIAA